MVKIVGMPTIKVYHGNYSVNFHSPGVSEELLERLDRRKIGLELCNRKDRASINEKFKNTNNGMFGLYNPEKSSYFEFFESMIEKVRHLDSREINEKQIDLDRHYSDLILMQDAYRDVSPTLKKMRSKSLLLMEIQKAKIEYLKLEKNKSDFMLEKILKERPEYALVDLNHAYEWTFGKDNLSFYAQDSIKDTRFLSLDAYLFGCSDWTYNKLDVNRWKRTIFDSDRKMPHFIGLFPEDEGYFEIFLGENMRTGTCMDDYGKSNIEFVEDGSDFKLLKKYSDQTSRLNGARFVHEGTTSIISNTLSGKYMQDIQFKELASHKDFVMIPVIDGMENSISRLYSLPEVAKALWEKEHQRWLFPPEVAGIGSRN